jgi:hypothetical protein
MSKIWLWLAVLIALDLVAGCSQISPTLILQPESQPISSSPGRWEIIPTATVEINTSDPAWKFVRIPIVIENRLFHFASARISVSGAHLRTTQSITDAILYQTAGSNPVQTNNIEFPDNIIVPPGFRIGGIYRNDAPAKYFFQAKVSKPLTVTTLEIPGYAGTIPLTYTAPISLPYNSNRQNGIELMHGPIEIAGKAMISVTDVITQLVKEHQEVDAPAHDRVFVKIQLINLSSAADTSVDVRVVAIGDNGILGCPDTDEILSCGKPPFKIGPAMTMPVTVCSIIPRGTHNVYIIFSGDLHAVYKAPF